MSFFRQSWKKKNGHRILLKKKKQPSSWEKKSRYIPWGSVNRADCLNKKNSVKLPGSPLTWRRRRCTCSVASTFIRHSFLIYNRTLRDSKVKKKKWERNGHGEKTRKWKKKEKEGKGERERDEEEEEEETQWWTWIFFSFPVLRSTTRETYSNIFKYKFGGNICIAILGWIRFFFWLRAFTDRLFFFR